MYLVYAKAIWYIFGCLLYFFSRFGILYQGKSGNPDFTPLFLLFPESQRPQTWNNWQLTEPARCTLFSEWKFVSRAKTRSAFDRQKAFLYSCLVSEDGKTLIDRVTRLGEYSPI
jgi:hypothetical protein